MQTGFEMKTFFAIVFILLVLNGILAAASEEIPDKIKVDISTEDIEYDDDWNEIVVQEKTPVKGEFIFSPKNSTCKNGILTWVVEGENQRYSITAEAQNLKITFGNLRGDPFSVTITNEASGDVKTSRGFWESEPNSTTILHGIHAVSQSERDLSFSEFFVFHASVKVLRSIRDTCTR